MEPLRKAIKYGVACGAAERSGMKRRAGTEAQPTGSDERNYSEVRESVPLIARDAVRCKNAAKGQ